MLVTHSIERPYGVYPWFDFALVVEVDDFQEGRLYTVGFSHGSDLKHKTHRVAGVAFVVIVFRRVAFSHGSN